MKMRLSLDPGYPAMLIDSQEAGFRGGIGFKFVKNQKYNFNQRGYIALMSAIIMACLLLVLSCGLGFCSFFSRFDILDSEYKERSNSLAEACANMVVLRLAQGQSVNATGTVVVTGNDLCKIFPVQQNLPAAGQLTIKTQGIFPAMPPEQAYTNLTVIIKSSDLSALDWFETN